MGSKDLKRTNLKTYAAGALAELRRQLETAKTEAKKAKILARIAKWEKEL